jgi:hypothetical protein
MHVKRYRLSMFIIILLSASLIFSIPHSVSTSSFDYSVLIQYDEIQLIPGKNMSVPLFINQTENATGIVTLQGKWIENTPKGIIVTLQPTTGLTPFTSTVTFRSSILANPGLYTYQICGQSEGINHTTAIHINITTDLTVTLCTNKNQYFNGQQINLYGNATSLTEEIIDSGDVILSIANGKYNISITTQIQNGSFNYLYPISYGDKDGVWTIKARVVDTKGHIGIQSKDLTVSLPPDIMRFVIDFYSPPNNAVYQRGDSFDISVFVTENLQSVRNATTLCRLPSLETIPLIEYSPGNYKQKYIIPWDAPIGEWSFTVECIKNSSGIIEAGGNALSISIEPAPLQLTILEPQTLQFPTDSKISFKVEVRYLDATLMKTGTVRIATSHGNISLQNENNGIYTTNVTVTGQDIGSQVFEISAMDLFGNEGSTKKILLISSETQSSILVIVIPLFTAALCGLIGLVLIKRIYRSQRLKSLQDEMMETQRLQEEAVKKYYKEGSISKEIYDALIFEHTQRYAHLQKEERKITHK